MARQDLNGFSFRGLAVRPYWLLTHCLDGEALTAAYAAIGRHYARGSINLSYLAGSLHKWLLYAGLVAGHELGLVRAGERLRALAHHAAGTDPRRLVHLAPYAARLLAQAHRDYDLGCLVGEAVLLWDLLHQ